MCLFHLWFSQSICPVAGLLGHMVVLFLVFLRILHTVLHSGCINLHSHQECKKIPFFSTPSPTFIVYRFFDDGHSDCCELLTHCSFDLHLSNNEWCWVSFLIFVGHLYVSLEKSLFRSSSHFLIGLFVFLVLSCLSCLCVLEIKPLSIVSFAIIFSLFWGLSFHLVYS